MATTLDIYLPFDAGAGANITEAQWREMARHWLDDGVFAGEGDEVLVYADSSGLQVKIKTGNLWLHGHYGQNLSEKILAVAAAHATLARIDRVVARADFTNNRIEFDVLTGSPNASPVAPALTQSSTMWEISLATVSVPATDTVIDAGQVTDTRDFAFYDNDATTSYTPAWTGAVSNPAIGNGTLAGHYRRRGRLVYLRIVVVVGSTSTVGSGLWLFGLPAGMTLAGTAGTDRHVLDFAAWNASGAGAGVKPQAMGKAYGTVAGSTLSAVMTRDASSAFTDVGSANPFGEAWATGDRLVIEGTVEVA